MADKKDAHKEFSTCFEKLPFAEMMWKRMSRQGVGSLCAEMMEKVMERQGDGCNFDCAKMMRRMMKERSRVQEEPEKSKEEVYHGRKES
jgi:coproporphyrinogen III oxidase